MIIGMIAAMENELRPFLQKFSFSRQLEICQNTFYINESKDQTIVAVCSGRGKVNATIYAQLLLTHFTPDILINVGVSGGIAEESKIYDIYVGTEYCHYDVRKKQSQYTFPKKLYYQGDPSMIELTNQYFPNVKNGIFGSGEGFVSDDAMKEILWREFAISAVDMESAAIAQCCYLNEIRYISLRGICDKANEKAVHTTEELQEMIADKVCELVAKLVQKI
ncbi:5'-methylthioadenosine/S-adenosylhomocysteine nucleosidase [Enterococcus sp. LJL99]